MKLLVFFYLEFILSTVRPMFTWARAYIIITVNVHTECNLGKSLTRSSRLLFNSQCEIAKTLCRHDKTGAVEVEQNLSECALHFVSRTHIVGLVHFFVTGSWLRWNLFSLSSCENDFFFHIAVDGQWRMTVKIGNILICGHKARTYCIHRDHCELRIVCMIWHKNDFISFT